MGELMRALAARLRPAALAYRLPRLYELAVFRLVFPWLGMGPAGQTAVVEEMLWPEGRLLEAPVGTGYLTFGLYAERPGVTAVGVDLALPMLKLASAQLRRRGIANVHLVCADMTVLPFANDTFGQIVTLNGLHVLPRPEPLVDELLRVAEDGAAVAGSAGVDIRAEPRGGLQRLLARLGVINPLNAEALHELLGLTWSKLSARRSGGVYVFQRPKLDRMTGQPLPAYGSTGSATTS